MAATREWVRAADVRVGDIVSGYDTGTLDITDAATGGRRDSFRGRVLDVETERVERTKANGGPYDNPVRIVVENLSGDTVWHVAPFLSITGMTREGEA